MLPRYEAAVKNLLAHTKTFKSTTDDAIGKVAQAVDSLVKLTEEDGGELALSATRLRSIVARIQVGQQPEFVDAS